MELCRIPQLFGIEGGCSIAPLKTGHINSTYKVTAADGEYILQSLNRSIFRRPEDVMANISAVQQAFERSGRTGASVPEYLISDGRNYTETDGEFWRMYSYIEPDKSEGKDHITGYAFGTFIRVVDGAELIPVIEGYHDFGWYYSRLRAVAPDGCTAPELNELSSLLSSVFTSVIPRRNVHGDAKTDNVITGEIPTIIDLDTVMYGYAALDFGDMIRSLSTGSRPDLSRMEDAVRGFAEGLDGLLTSDEVSTLYYGILWTTGELAVRYLTDSMSREKYFRGKTEKECRDRAEELLGQLRIFLRLRGEIEDIIERSFG